MKSHDNILPHSLTLVSSHSLSIYDFPAPGCQVSQDQVGDLLPMFSYALESLKYYNNNSLSNVIIIPSEIIFYQILLGA